MKDLENNLIEKREIRIKKDIIELKHMFYTKVCVGSL